MVVISVSVKSLRRMGNERGDPPMTKKDKVILRLFGLSAFIIIISVIVTGYSVNKVAYQKGFEAGQNNMGLIKDIIQLKIGELDRSCHHLDNQTICFYPNGTWTASWRSP